MNIDRDRASESIAEMVADWYGNAPLPNARITADVIAQRLDRFAGQSAVPANSVLSLTSASLSDAIEALRVCVEAMSQDHPGDDSYWDAVRRAEATIAKAEGC